jgi:hypothetical protein
MGELRPQFVPFKVAPLSKLLVKDGPTHPKILVGCIRQLLSAVMFLNEQGYCYGEILSSNIYFEGRMHIKLEIN